MQATNRSESWPALDYAQWQDTCATLHLWTQVVGKVRLALTPWVNHSWHSALYLTSRGLTTSPVPYSDGSFQIDFDFIDHLLQLSDSHGETRTIELKPRSVADFYAAVMDALTQLDVHVSLNKMPNEITDAVPFDQDTEHCAYDAAYARRFWDVLRSTEQVFAQFRTGFLGKVSPVHFFWGSFDLAVTRFSGRTAPLHKGGVPNLPDSVAREAYSHEVSSAGFWPGNGGLGYAAYYSYAYPEPPGYRDVRLPVGRFEPSLGEFLLPYEEVRTAADPAQTLMSFLDATYSAAADAARWDRAALECAPGQPRVPRPVA